MRTWSVGGVRPPGEWPGVDALPAGPGCLPRGRNARDWTRLDLAAIVVDLDGAIVIDARRWHGPAWRSPRPSARAGLRGGAWTTCAPSRAAPGQETGPSAGCPSGTELPRQLAAACRSPTVAHPPASTGPVSTSCPKSSVSRAPEGPGLHPGAASRSIADYSPSGLLRPATRPTATGRTSDPAPGSSLVTTSTAPLALRGRWTLDGRPCGRRCWLGRSAMALHKRRRSDVRGTADRRPSGARLMAATFGGPVRSATFGGLLRAAWLFPLDVGLPRPRPALRLAARAVHLRARRRCSSSWAGCAPNGPPSEPSAACRPTVASSRAGRPRRRGLAARASCRACRRPTSAATSIATRSRTAASTAASRSPARPSTSRAAPRARPYDWIRGAASGASRTATSAFFTRYILRRRAARDHQRLLDGRLGGRHQHALGMNRHGRRQVDRDRTSTRSSRRCALLGPGIPLRHLRLSAVPQAPARRGRRRPASRGSATSSTAWSAARAWPRASVTTSSSTSGRLLGVRRHRPGGRHGRRVAGQRGAPPAGTGATRTSARPCSAIAPACPWSSSTTRSSTSGGQRGRGDRDAR